MIKISSIIYYWFQMIKSLLILFFISLSLFAKTVKTDISKYEIKEGKKIFFPIQTQVITKTVSTEVIKYTINLPVFKAYFIEYTSK